MECLFKYQSWSRQTINMKKKKSSIMSNKNVRSGSIKEVCRVLNLKKSPNHSSLQLPWSPLCHQRSKSSSLNFFIEKIYQRIQGWRLKWCLRQLQAYNMLDQVSGYYCPQFMFTSSFNFSNSTCYNIDGLLRDF